MAIGKHGHFVWLAFDTDQRNFGFKINFLFKLCQVLQGCLLFLGLHMSFLWWLAFDKVPQGSILGPLLSLVYINDLADCLLKNAKLFADDTSLFSLIHDVDTYANKLINK